MGLTFFDELCGNVLVEPEPTQTRKPRANTKPKASEEPDRLASLESSIEKLSKAIIPETSASQITAPVITEQNPIIKKVDDMLANNSPESAPQ